MKLMKVVFDSVFEPSVREETDAVGALDLESAGSRVGVQIKSPVNISAIVCFGWETQVAAYVC